MTPKADQENWNGVAKKTVNNSVWSFLGFALGKLVAFAATVVLANLLVPEQFGLVGFCLVAMQFIDIIGRFGFDTALVSRGDSAEEDGSTVLFMGLAAAILGYAIAWFSAPTIAAFFNAPEIEFMLRVLAIVVIIDALTLVPNALLSLRLRFRQRLKAIVAKSIAKGTTSIAFALQGFGVWSLIYGQIAGSIVAVIAFWLLCDWRPKLRFNKDVSRQVLRYGGSMIGVELIGAVRSSIDLTLVGRFIGPAGLGLYTLAYKLPELVIRSLSEAVGKVSHPVLVDFRNDPQKISGFYLTYIRYIALLTLPLGVGMAAVSEAFVLTFYGPNWEMAVFPMQAISIALAITSVSFAPGVLYKALNRPDILRNIAIVKLPFLIGVTWYAIRWGIDGVALAKLLLATVFVWFDCYTVSRFTKIPISSVWTALFPALLASAGMGILVSWMTQSMTNNGIWEIAAAVAVG
ncbi:MAG: lipopolysaccharide biosynthesis protein, partial [Paracoccaceae bacterium]